MTAYRYWQKDEHARWWPIEDGPDVEKRAKEQGAKKLTILSLNVVLDEEEKDRDGILYSGPLYFDLDYKEGLDVVIESAKELCEKLEALQVPPHAIEIYLSGSKGVHVIVPAKAFSNGRAKKDLPQIYKRMAYHLHVRGMDFQVYSAGRGNSFRLVNVERYDGKYRVPITREELAVLTPDAYREMVKAPRNLPKYEQNFEGTPATSLKAMMERCEKELSKKIAVVELTDAEVTKIKGTVPACADMLADYKVRADANFNEVAFQLGIFLSRVQPGDADEKSLVSRLASKGKSSQYDSERKRYGHAIGAVRYVKANPRYKFSCRAMRQMLVSKPCEGCTLENVALPDGENVSRLLGIYEDDGGTWIRGEENDRQVLSFGLEATDVFSEWSQNGKVKRRVGAMVDMKVAGENRYSSILLPESAWASKSSFISATQGLRGVAFLGSSDIDVQKLKLHVFRNEDTMGEIVSVHTAGIMFERDVMQEEGAYRVYVEPGWSLDQFTVAGTHHLASRIQAPPTIGKYALPPKGDPTVKIALENLLEINQPHIMAQLLGWFMACHLKAHIGRAFAQFPVLSVWGNAEAGKTQTTALLACLNGCDYLRGESPLNVSKATDFPLMLYISSTTTVPRLMEEFNKSLMEVRRYNSVTEILKSAYNELAWSRGTIRRSKVDGPNRLSGADAMDIPVTAPLVTVSEQAPTIPAVVQRSIQVLLSKSLRAGREEFFFEAKRYRHQLHQVARGAVLLALSKSVKQVDDMVNANEPLLPARLVDRPRFNYLVALAGLDFMSELCGEANLALGIEDKIAGLKTALVSHLNREADSIARSKERSEVDGVMEAILQMIGRGLATNDIKDSELVPGAHYHIDKRNKRLYLHVPVVHSIYRTFARRQGDPVAIDNVRTFETLLRQEPYFLGDKEMCPGQFNQRPVWLLGIEEMTDKGLTTSHIT